eukprot:jgi/Phyca11/106325/e_gw1.12.208.1
MPHLEFGDKVVLPPEILLELQCLKVPNPFLFSIRATGVDIQLDGELSTCSRQYCSVQEFSAPDGQVFLPYWLMQNLGVPEGGSVVVASVTNPPRAIYCRFQPETMSFLDLAADIGPKLLMETALRRYSILSVGSTIVIQYRNTRYYVRVAELKPASVVSLCGDVDLETDFMPPDFECSICHEEVLRIHENQHRHCPHCSELYESDEALADHERGEHIASVECTSFLRPLLAQGRMRRKGDSSALRSTPSQSRLSSSTGNNQLNYLIGRTSPPSFGLSTTLPKARAELQVGKQRKLKPRLNPQLRALPKRTVDDPQGKTSSDSADLCISSAGGTSFTAHGRYRVNTRVKARHPAKGPSRLNKLSGGTR